MTTDSLQAGAVLSGAAVRLFISLELVKKGTFPFGIVLNFSNVSFCAFPLSGTQQTISNDKKLVHSDKSLELSFPLYLNKRRTV